MPNHSCWRQNNKAVLSLDGSRHSKRRPSRHHLLLQLQHQHHQQQQDCSQLQLQREQQHQQQQQQGSPNEFDSQCVAEEDNLTVVCFPIQIQDSCSSVAMGSSNPALVAICLLAMCLVSVCLYQVYVILNRTLPADLAEADKIRWLDALGRLANNGHTCLHEWIGIDAGIDPIKTFINTAFSLLFNPLPTQRLVYRSIKASQDVYAGVPVSTYTPVNPPPTGRKKGLHPTIIYFHGGGWTWLSVGVYDGPLKHLANSTQFKVIAVEYRKAPEHPFPAAYTDCLAVTKYVWQHAKDLHVQQDAIVVAGDGAGGNLAAAVANEMSGNVRMQILISPALQMLNLATPSYQDYSDHLLPGITSPSKEVNNWIRYGNINPEHKKRMLDNTHVSLKQFDSFVDSSKWLPPKLSHVTSKQTKNKPEVKTLQVQSEERVNKENPQVPASEHLVNLIHDSRFSPMFTSDVRHCPQAYILTAQYDVLRDEALMYGQRLRHNGVVVEFRHYMQGFHGFFMFAGGGWLELAESKKAMQDLVTYLNRHVLNVTI